MRLSRRFSLSICAFFISTSSLLGILAGCSQPNNAPHPEPEVSRPVRPKGLLPSGRTLRFVDEQDLPVQGKVMIGIKANVPFTGNILDTNSAGEIAIPAEWHEPLPVTISAAGYVRTTYLSRQALAETYRVRAASGPLRLEVKGTTTGFGTLSKDKWVDVGLLTPTLSRARIASFQMSDLVSPESDVISVVGQDTEVPSNITLPKQTENYVIPITIDKPGYRLYFDRERNFQVAAIHARFPMKPVVDVLRRGGSFMDAINFFQFKSASLREVIARRSGMSIDIPVNEMEFSSSVPFTAPPYDPQLTLLMLAMIPARPGEYFPSDVKAIKPGETLPMGLPMGAGQALLAGVLHRLGADKGVALEELSISLQSANQSTATEFLPMVRGPQLRGMTLALNPPPAMTTTATAVAPIGGFVALSSVRPGTGQIAIDNKQTLWEIYSDDWASQIELPELDPLTAPTGSHLRWESAFMAAAPGTRRPDVNGADNMDVYTHVTRNATDL